MILDRLSAELERVASRYRRLWSWQLDATALLIGAMAGFFARYYRISWLLRSPVYSAAAVAAVATLVAYVILRSRSLRVQQQWLAHRIEARFPDLNSGLLAAVEQHPDLPDGRYGFLQVSLIRDALQHAARNNWMEVVSGRRLALAVLANFAAFALLVGAVTVGPRSYPQLTKPGKEGKRPSVATGDFAVTVEPGNVEIERGTSLLVLARVKGPMPAEATLFAHPEGSEPTRLGMNASLDDPIFGGRVNAVMQPLEYRVEVGGFVSPNYKVIVFEYPRLERADARLVYPNYTGMETRLVQDIRTVSVVEGTQVTLICKLNKPVKSARFTEAAQTKKAAAPPADKPPVPESVEEKEKASQPAETVPQDLALRPRETVAANNSKPAKQEASESQKVSPTQAAALNASPKQPLVENDGAFYEVTFTPEKTRRLKLELVDEAGRRNNDNIVIVVQVVPNQPPTLKLVAPGRDLEVSPLEELDLKATAWDDFGVKRMGVSYGLAGQEPVDVVLGQDAAGRQKHELNNQVRFEELKAEPDQLLAYHFWAEDYGADGKLRRTSSDMYFAEVRHFDEIFRQGQQPPGGQQQRQQQQQGGGQNAQQAQQLAQLQKDIINATWKLIRREAAPQPTAPFAEDVKQIADSQGTALEQADALGERVQDSESQAHLLTVLESMQAAVKQLNQARDDKSVKTLQPALVAEQSAYQALLKLRAREHEVVRQQRQQSGSPQANQGARSGQQRQQMDQLDLKDEENRYETQSVAQAQAENPEDRETRQVLNRLKELARRQHDLNERLKDLQSALQEAQTEEKKDEIRQQLKRLQEEQRDVLRDTDELQNRMDTPENQERMADERQQLQQARDQVQRASESLDQDKVTQAAASGTRAEREFDDLRNEFRRRASGRFNEEMREMREAARDLDQQEKKLSEQLTKATQPDPEKKTLRDEVPSEEIVKGLNDQKTKLSNLNERVKQTIQEAEETEPLLSERLNDAARNLMDQKVDRALEATEQSVRRGLMDDARQVEQIAGRGINQLKEGIEKAAEAVLGDETEALRRAREQLKDLSRELNQEIARKAPGEVPQTQQSRDANDSQAGRPPNGEQQEGQQPGNRPSGDPQQNARGQNGERPMSEQPGEGQARERRSGERQGDERQADQQRGGQRQRNQGERGQAQPGEQQPGERQPGEQQSEEGQPGQPGEPQEGQQGEQQREGQQPGQRGRQQRGQQPGSQAGRQPGQQQPGEAQEGQPQEGNAEEGQPMPGEQGQPEGQAGQQQNEAGQPNQRGRNGQRGARQNQRGARNGGQNDPRGIGGSLNNAEYDEFAPISGRDYLDWSDRLRDVEEMIDDAELRAEVARIRDAARSIRAETKRHSKEPNWNLVRVSVAEPLVELSNRVADELLRRSSKQALVPLDRDPVPPKYSEKTRRYYERLGSGQ